MVIFVAFRYSGLGKPDWRHVVFPPLLALLVLANLMLTQMRWLTMTPLERNAGIWLTAISMCLLGIDVVIIGLRCLLSRWNRVGQSAATPSAKH